MADGFAPKLTSVVFLDKQGLHLYKGLARQGNSDIADVLKQVKEGSLKLGPELEGGADIKYFSSMKNSAEKASDEVVVVVNDPDILSGKYPIPQSLTLNITKGCLPEHQGIENDTVRFVGPTGEYTDSFTMGYAFPKDMKIPPLKVSTKLITSEGKRIQHDYTISTDVTEYIQTSNQRHSVMVFNTEEQNTEIPLADDNPVDEGC